MINETTPRPMSNKKNGESATPAEAAAFDHGNGPIGVSRCAGASAAAEGPAAGRPRDTASLLGGSGTVRVERAFVDEPPDDNVAFDLAVDSLDVRSDPLDRMLEAVRASSESPRAGVESA